MKTAVYNPTTNRILTWVTEPKGALPEGFEFRSQSEVPSDATMHVSEVALEPVPEQVTLRQFLMAADRSGLLAAMEALKVNEAIPPQTRRDIHFFIEYSNFIERNHPLIAQLAPVISIDGQPITDAQIDDVFRLASSL